MLRLRTFGGLDLRRSDGDEVRRVVAQPRRAALLVYLAMAPAEGFLRRDRLLPLFWPERDDVRARASLNRAVYFLRHELGPDIIVSRGDEIGLDGSRLWCDARVFDAAIKNREHHDALELYQGDLLPGFFPSEAPEFERWLDIERGRLRQCASDAAWALADQTESAGDLPTAVHWAQRAVELAPFDEAGLQRLLMLLDRAGDRAGAARAYKQFADDIAAELELAPSPETRALFENIRTRTHRRVVRLESRDGEKAPVGPAVTPPPEPSRESVTERQGSRGRPMRMPNRFVLTAAAGLCALSLAWTVRPRRIEPTLIRVAAFENSSGDSALSDLARLTSMRVAGGLRQATPFKHVEFPNEKARRWLRHRPALLVSGMLRSRDGRAVLDVAIKDLRTGGTVWPLPSFSVTMETPDSIIDHVRSRVLGGVAAIGDVASARFFPVASTPPMLDAFEEYRDGQQLAAQGRLSEAIKRYRWAAEIDTTFTWPLVEAAILALRVGSEAGTDSALVALTRTRRRLNPLQRDLVAYVEAIRATNWPEARRALRSAAQLAPERFAYRYAISASHVNCPREVVSALSRPGLDTLYRDSTLRYWNVLTLAYHQLGEHETELAVARRARAYRQGSIAALTEELRSLAAMGKTSEVLALLDSVVWLPREGWFTPAASMEAAARELLAHGHPGAARVALERAVAWHHHRPAEEEATEARRAQLADLLYLLGDLDEAERRFNALVEIDSTNPYYVASLGAIASRRGRRATAVAIADRLRVMERAVPVPGNDAVLGRARIAALLGDNRQALELLVAAFGPAGTDMLHLDADFEGLRNDPQFREFIRPKG